MSKIRLIWYIFLVCQRYEKIYHYQPKIKATPHIFQIQAQRYKNPFAIRKRVWQCLIISRKAHWIRPTEFFCQPNTDSPMRTLYNFWQSAFAGLGIVFSDTRKVVWRPQKHIQLYNERTICHVLSFWRHIDRFSKAFL